MGDWFENVDSPRVEQLELVFGFNALITESLKFNQQVGYTEFTVHFVIACTDVDRVVCTLLFANYQNEIEQAKLSVSDFLVHSTAIV